MHTTTELWWRDNYTWDRVAHIAFARSRGATCGDCRPPPVGLLAEPKSPESPELLERRTRTSLSQPPYVGTLRDPLRYRSLPWIFKQPLPRLCHLRIRLFHTLDDENEPPMPDAVVLHLPAGLPLRVLDLSNTTLSWSSNLFAGPSELHVGFKDCGVVADILVDELFGIFNASSRLVRLSLAQIRPRVPVRKGVEQCVSWGVLSRSPRVSSCRCVGWANGEGASSFD